MTTSGALNALSNFFPSASRNAEAGPRSSGAKPLADPRLAKSGGLLGQSADSTITEAFEQIVYRKQIERAALSFQRSQGETTESSESSASEQLSFSFHAEYEVVNIERFQQRIARAAENAGSDAQRTQLLEAARSVSARFSLSIEISASALSGFASGAEESAESSGSALDQFLAFAQEALDKLDSLFNDIFEVFDGFLNGSLDIENKFDEVFSKLKSLFNGFGEIPSGTSQSNFSVQLEFEFESIEITRIQASDPIVLDLDGDGFEFTDVARGANFDLLANGRAQRTAFVTGGDALLAIDRNGNGVIDDGSELFGDQRGAANGFEELRKLDSNGDGVIDANDERFYDLRLFRDDGDGRTERGELLQLKDAGITSIDLGYSNVDEEASGGNRLAQVASFRHADGRFGRIADALLNLIV